MTPLDRLYACAIKSLAYLEEIIQYRPGSTDNALEDALVDAEAETEVHEPAARTAQSLGVDERDATWRSAVGTLWRWDESRWWHSDHPNIWIATPHDYRPDSTGPFVATDLPTTAIPYVAMDSRMPAMDWRGWAVPAILEVLAEHDDIVSNGSGITCDCRCGQTLFDSWSDHVAKLIADRIACDPGRAIEALSHYRPDTVSP